jgi:hypothetical protein
MHAALFIDRCRSDARTIACQQIAEFGHLHVGDVLFDQSRHTQPAAALAPIVRDLEHRDLAGEVAERDGAAAYNERS